MPPRPPRNPFDRGRRGEGRQRRSELAPFAPPRTARLPVIARPRILAKGPRAFQASLGVAQRGVVPYPLPVPPPNSIPGWRGGPTTEWAIFWAAWRPLGLKPGIDFEHQGTFAGGHNLPGGFVPDFVFYGPAITVNVQGEVWHYQAGTGQQALDRAQAGEVAKYGLRAIWIDGADALRDPEYYLREALAGIDHSIGARGVV